jgi:hypothetical protein
MNEALLYTIYDFVGYVTAFVVCYYITIMVN